MAANKKPTIILQEQYFLYARSRLLLDCFERTPSKVAASELQIMSQQLAHICVCILENTLEQIHALGACFVPKAEFSTESLGEVAKHFFDDDPVFDLQTGEYFADTMDKRKLRKIYYDSAKLADILQKLKYELKHDYSFISLKQILNDVNDFNMDKQKLFEDEKYNRQSMITTRNKLWMEERNSKHQEQKLNEQIALLKDQAEDTQFWSLICTRYVEQWEQARVEQTHLKCYQEEIALEDVILNVKNMIDKENKANTDIESYIFENLKDSEREIESWKKRYDKEYEKKTVKIQIIKEKQEELAKEYNALKAVYDRHKKEMDDYLEYKEKQRVAEEYKAVLATKATKIQAWWRGLRVRLQLQPKNPNLKKKRKAKKI